MLQGTDLTKWYFRGRGSSNRFFAVKGVSLTLLPGTVTVLTGRSGSGKTTLLQMMAGLLTPDEGRVLMRGEDLHSLPEEKRSQFRNAHFGMIPQGADLLPQLTVMENLLLPLRIYEKGNGKEYEQEALALLGRMGVEDLAPVPARELSGGERRRVCTARALLGNREVLFADEPTSDLDEENLYLVLDLLKEKAKQGAAVLIVTHDREALSIADAHFQMDSGVLRAAETASA